MDNGVRLNARRSRRSILNTRQMNYALLLVFSYSILLPFLISVLRFKVIAREYHPFIYLLLLGVVNEIISTILNYKGYSNAVNSNIYVLLESVMLVWLFARWKLFRRPALFYALLIFLISFWLFENFYISKISYFSSYFRILYSFVIVLMSIQIVNRLIVREQRSLVKNSMFIISVGFIIYYIYKILVEIFWVYGLNNSKEFQNDVYNILHFINLFTNLIFALAILWMPRKREFMLQS
jgi:hypothetical protein